MNLGQYISKVQGFSNNIDSEIERIIKKKKGYIGGLWKRNRYNRGFVPSLGDYADSTIRQKQAKGRRTSPFNLFNEGEWYDTLEPFYNVQTKELQMYSTRPRFDATGKKDVNFILISKYGWKIFDFTNEESNFVVTQIIDEELAKTFPNTDFTIPGF